MAKTAPRRKIGAMTKKILPLIAALGLCLAATAHADKHGDGGDFKLTGKTVGFTQIDLGDPGFSVGDQQIISMDVFAGPKRVGESHVLCTMVRADKTTHAFTGQCENVTSLPAGQITASGIVTSDDEEKRPFIQAITGGTGAYKQAHGQLTVSEAGPQPATLAFDLS
jgi:hypothetical protein